MASAPAHSDPAAQPSAYERAAQKIIEADILLVAWGAGFSQDSGLAVYKDIADIPAYHKMMVTYAELCTPYWIDHDPEIFFGFWGTCFNDYRRVTPHAGYNIIKRWRDEYFAPTEDVRKFFVYTSNVDAHAFRVGFEPNEVHQIHGTIEEWQCARQCIRATVRAPSAPFEFDVRRDTMRAPPVKGGPLKERDEDRPAITTTRDDHEESAAATDTDTASTAPSEASSSSPAKAKSTTLSISWENHPRCEACGQLARPAILMFGDGEWQEDDEEETRYLMWRSAMRKYMNEFPEKKMCIVEMGAGIRVPTVRHNSHAFLSDIPNCSLVRINPDYPEISDAYQAMLRNGFDSSRLVPIKENALSALLKIDEYIKTMAASRPKKPTPASS